MRNVEPKVDTRRGQRQFIKSFARPFARKYGTDDGVSYIRKTAIKKLQTKIVVLLQRNSIDDMMWLAIGSKRKQKSVIEVADMAVEVERKWIKNLYLRISPTNARIRISAPMMMSEEAIRRFVLSKEAWIKQRVKRAGEKKQPTPREYVAGEVHYYKGHGYRLKVVYHNGPAKVETVGNEYIILYIREGATKERRAAILKEWYRAELKALLTELIGKWEQIIGVKANRTTIKQMKTRWGSCNHRTHDINFNLELMKRPVHCIEYVVVHELLHIIVRLHNEQFKSLLTHYLPNWRQTKEELNSFTR